MFLQLVAGGHLLLFVTRSEGWFFRPPFPALPLFAAILATQALAVLMCGFGWLVPAIPWKTIAWVWAYNLVWMFVLGGVRVATERLLDHRTVRRAAERRHRQRAAARRAAGVEGGSAWTTARSSIVEPGSKVRLKAIDPGYHGKHETEDERQGRPRQGRRPPRPSCSTCSTPRRSTRS